MDDVVATKLLWRAFRAELQEERARSPEVTAWVLVGNLRWLALKQPAHFFACTAPICRGRNLTVEPRRYTHPVKPQGRQERFTFLSFWSVKSCITCIPFLLLDVWLPVSELLPMANAPWQLPFTSNHCNLHHNTRTLIESNSADSASAQKWIRRPNPSASICRTGSSQTASWTELVDVDIKVGKALWHTNPNFFSPHTTSGRCELGKGLALRNPRGGKCSWG